MLEFFLVIGIAFALLASATWLMIRLIRKHGIPELPAEIASTEEYSLRRIAMADNELLIRNWHQSLIRQSSEVLGRPLSPDEKSFITSRASFVSLEMIEDTVRSSGAVELECYLRSQQARDTALDQ
jgi:hypothetical protein